MAGSVNKVILVGNLGRDPEIRSMPNGDRIANFSLATSETWRDKSSGERKEKTEWHNIVIRNENIGKVAQQYLRKGSEVYIEGAITTRKWQDQSGADRYTTEIVVGPFKGEMTLIGGRDGGGGRDTHDFNQVQDSPAGAKKRDVITDLTPGQDVLDLSGIDADTTVPGDQAFHWVGTTTFTGTPGELGYAKSGGNTIIRASTDTDPAPEVEIQLNGNKTPTANDVRS